MSSPFNIETLQRQGLDWDVEVTRICSGIVSLICTPGVSSSINIIS